MKRAEFIHCVLQTLRGECRSAELLIEWGCGLFDDEGQERKLTHQLKASARELAKAVAANQPNDQPEMFSVDQSSVSRKESPMANPILAALTQQVQANTDVEASATILINGFADRVQKAVDAAIANGATAAELAPVQNEVDALKASSAALSAAVVANTP